MMTSEDHSLEPNFIFGLTTTLSNSCLFMTDEKIVYHAAGVLVIHDTVNKSQEYLYPNDRLKVITAMDINKGRNLIAVAEKGKKPSVGIYNLKNFKHVRQLPLHNDSKAKSFIKIKFSYNDVFLAVLSDSPDYIMYYYDWNQSKIESHVQVILPPSIPGLVHEMTLNPAKNRLCCFVGTGLFRMMEMKELVWKQYGFHKAKKFNFTAACWLNEYSVMAGTQDGRLFLFVRGDLKAVYNAETLLEFDAGLTDQNQLMVLPLLTERHSVIRHCTPVINGLMFVVDGNRIYYYKRIVKQQYKKSIVFHLTGPDDRHSDGSHVTTINTLCVSPKNTYLACVTEDDRLYLAHTIDTVQSSDVFIEPYGAMVHAGGVCGLSISDWMPVFMTCGTVDRTVKLWDYQKRELLLTKRYAEDVLDVSLHPSGLFALVAFPQSVAFTTVSCTDGLAHRRTFRADHCRATRFSDSGHMFTVIDGTVVDVYCSLTYDRCFKLTGHTSAITDHAWAANDWKIYTVDGDGGMCSFNLYTGQHITNVKFQQQNMCGVAVSNDLKQIYTAAQDSRIREIYGRTVIRKKDLDHGPLNGIILSKSNEMLLVTCQYGVILSLTLPLKSNIKYKELIIHNKTISKMKLSPDDTMLITCSADDSICIWKAKNSNVLHATTTFMENTLVSADHLKNKIDIIEKLQSKLKELTKWKARDENKLTKTYETQLKIAQDDYNLKMKRIEKEKKEMLALYHADKERMENGMKLSKEKHDQDWIISKDNYEKQLSYEDDKYEQFIKDSSTREEDLKKEEETILAEHQRAIQRLTDDFSRDIKVEEDMLEQLKKHIAEGRDQVYLKIDEFDNQCDREMLELISYFETKFRKLTTETKKTQVVVNVYKEKLRTIQKQGVEFKFLLEKYQQDVEETKKIDEQLINMITESEIAISKSSALKYEKDEIIKSKILDLEDMKKQILLLQKYEIEQNSVINPLKMELNSVKLTLAKMNYELENANKELRRIKSECTIQEKKAALISGKTSKAKEYLQSQTMMIKYTIINIQFCFKRNTGNEAKLKDSVREMHRNFLTTDTSSSLKTDLSRKMMFLEKCLARLKTEKIAAERKTPMYLEIVEHSKVLVKVYNELKIELTANKMKLQHLECALKEKEKEEDVETSE